MSERFRQFNVLLMKDLAIEWRSREIAFVGGLFSIVLVSLFVFSGLNQLRIAAEAFPSALWVSVAFIGTVVFSRTFQREREHHAMEQLIMVRGVIGPVYASKLVTNIVLLISLELPLIFALFVTFRLDLGMSFCTVVAITALGTIGFSALGSVLSAALSTVSMREALLPVVLFPLSIPLFIAGAQAVSVALESGWTESLTSWLMIIAMFDVIFVLAGRWLFTEVVEPA